MNEQDPTQPKPPKSEIGETSQEEGIMPSSWFDAIYEGNAQYPFSNTGIAILLANAFLTEGRTHEWLEALDVNGSPWSFSDEQLVTFSKGMQTMHMHNGIKVAAEGKGEELEAGIEKRHGKKVKAREFTEFQIFNLSESSAGVALRLYQQIVDPITPHLGAQEAYTVARGSVALAANILRRDPEVQQALRAYKQMLKEYSFTGRGSDGLRSTPEYMTSRQVVLKAFMPKFVAGLPETTGIQAITSVIVRNVVIDSVETAFKNALLDQ